MAGQKHDGGCSRKGLHPDEGFAQFDRKRIAIELMHGEKPTSSSGEARLENDKTLGPVLRIILDGSPRPIGTAVLISEKEWDGLILPDSSYGCDYCFIPADQQ